MLREIICLGEVEERNIAKRDGEAMVEAHNCDGRYGDIPPGGGGLVTSSRRGQTNNTGRLVVMQVLEGQEHTRTAVQQHNNALTGTLSSSSTHSSRGIDSDRYGNQLVLAELGHPVAQSDAHLNP